MSNGVNKVILVGNLGSDPERRVTQGGTTVTNARLAVSTSFTKRDGDRSENTEWVRLVIFGRRADSLAEYARKGSKLYVEGRLQTQKWQDKEGNDRYTTEVVVDTFEFLDPKRSGGEGSRREGGGSNRDEGRGRSGGFDEPDDSIPF